MLYERIGRRIRAQRQLQKMTQAKLSEKAGISLSFLGHIERGTRKLSVDTLYRISLALNCSADELLDTGLFDTKNLSVKQLLHKALDVIDL